MSGRFSVGYELTAPAGSSGEAVAYTVIAGRKFRLKRVTFAFPAGSGFNLRLWLQRGNEKVAPNVGYIVGDGNVISLEVDVEYESGSPVIVGYSNQDAANEHKALVILEGVIE